MAYVVDDEEYLCSSGCGGMVLNASGSMMWGPWSRRVERRL